MLARRPSKASKNEAAPSKPKVNNKVVKKIFIVAPQIHTSGDYALLAVFLQEGKIGL